MHLKNARTGSGETSRKNNSASETTFTPVFQLEDEFEFIFSRSQTIYFRV